MNNKLDIFDLKFAVQRLPNNLIDLIKRTEWKDNLFIGGGYLRAIIAKEPINDIDIFCSNPKETELAAHILCKDKSQIIKTDNAYTIKDKIPLQLIHRWSFKNPKDVCDSFDFTICSAAIFFNFETKNWDSFCDERFYTDLAAKRLVYRSPQRNEDAGGSLLRVLKYYQRGYRIPLDSLGKVIARLVKELDMERLSIKDEPEVSKILTGLLREVDPNIDPLHTAHLPFLIEKV